MTKIIQCTCTCTRTFTWMFDKMKMQLHVHVHVHMLQLFLCLWGIFNVGKIPMVIPTQSHHTCTLRETLLLLIVIMQLHNRVHSFKGIIVNLYNCI